MKTYNEDMILSRNESFVFDRLLKNKDGSPYIISSQLSSPMIRMTVADDNYPSNERYVLNRYLSLKNTINEASVPVFYNTRPVRLMNESGYATSFEGLEPGDTYNPIVVEQGVTKYNYAVYYIVDGNTHENIYKYYVQDEPNAGHWEDYQLRITIPFGVEITKDWTSKNYIYGIFLMDGTLYIKVMLNRVAMIIVEEEGITYNEAYARAELMSEQILYDKILEYNNKDGHITDVALIDGKEVIIDRDNEKWSPYWTIDCDIPMLNPAKITVKNDPIGGLWS